MRCRIHRGAREIGGSCVEVEQDGRRIVLDVGRPLTASFEDELPLPAVDGLATGDPSLVGVVISHGHPDHFGLASQVHAGVPLYLGEATQRILSEASFFAPTGVELTAAGFLRDREPLQLGPFALTPYLVDHSAFDAYAVLVEAGGRRLFYSGDLRAHGRKPGVWRRLIDQPPTDVGVLLLEGTRLSRADDQTNVTEGDVEQAVADVCANTRGMVLACYSGQNIDRLVTVYRAAKRSGRTLVLDLYGAAVAAATRRATVPQADWDGVRVFVPLTQRIRVKRSGEFERTAAVREQRLFPEDLAAAAPSLVMTFRGSMANELERADCLDGAQAVWSMWPGYLEQESDARIREWFDHQSIPLTVAHASGHASAGDLQRLAAAIDAERVVPIHTAAPERYGDLFSRVEIREDGEWWDV